VSAFAVDDEKVANKKFAFTCPKCSSENIIDNRIIDSKEEKNAQMEESFFNDDFSVDMESPEKDREITATPESHEDDLFFDETPAEKEEKYESFDDELATEFPADDLKAETGKKERKINLEIEESTEFTDLDEEDIFAEKPAAAKKEKEDDLFADVPAFEAKDEFISFDEKEPAKASADEFEIELKEDTAKPEEDDIFFDDFDETPGTPEKPEKKEESLKEETDFEFEDIEIEAAPEVAEGEREKKLSSQDDIDALFAEEGIEFEEKPISRQSEIDFEDEITVDLDLLDIDLEESGEDKLKTDVPISAESVKTQAPLSEDISLDIDNLDIDLDETSLDADMFEEPVKTDKQKTKAVPSDEDITLDIDNLDIDLDETSLDADMFEEPVKTDKQKTKAVPSDEDITLDIDNLDIELDETSLNADMFEEPVKTDKQKTKAVPSDEDITLDIDNLDIDLDEISADTDMFEEPVKTEKPRTKAVPSDEDITLDIDNLDIDLDEISAGTDLFEEPAPIKETKSISKKEKTPEEDFNEEDIKLNLDDLDIDLDEIEERELIFEDDVTEKPAAAVRKKAKPLIEEEDEDESITIDLDTLEIEIAEESKAREGELSEEDEKLTLDDAGLTFDELTSEIKKHQLEEPVDEDLKLTLDEIDPDLTLDKIAQSGRIDTELLSDTLEELPEIDLDEYDAIVRQEESRDAKHSFDESEDDFIVFPETETGEEPKPDYDMFDYEESDKEKAPEKGSTFFSIDFSLKYSRLGAVLRLLGLYTLSMIPHFIVMLIYTALSSILGFINQIVILSTGRCVEDFALIIENTVRYSIYINTNIIGIVEDRPVYAGRESLDHPLQMNITYPLKYSKNLAILRLSVAGITLITLPHLILMSMLALTIPFVYLIGIIIVLITRRWPNILFIYLSKFYRYYARIASFITGITDDYPPFSFD